MKARSARVALLHWYLSHAWMRRSAAFSIASPGAFPVLRAAARAGHPTPRQFFPVTRAATATVAFILPPARFPGRSAMPAE